MKLHKNKQPAKKAIVQSTVEMLIEVRQLDLLILHYQNVSQYSTNIVMCLDLITILAKVAFIKERVLNHWSGQICLLN